MYSGNETITEEMIDLVHKMLLLGAQWRRVPTPHTQPLYALELDNRGARRLVAIRRGGQVVRVFDVKCRQIISEVK